MIGFRPSRFSGNFYFDLRSIFRGHLDGHSATDEQCKDPVALPTVENRDLAVPLS